MIERAREHPQARRLEDARQRVADQVDAGRLDPADARWEMLRQTFRAGHAYQTWVSDGAPRRRAGDRSN